MPAAPAAPTSAARAEKVRRRRRARARRVALVTTVSLAAGAAAVGGVVLLLDRLDPSPPPPLECTATLDTRSWRLSLTQADNAALISAVTLRRDLPARAATIGLATALQESRLVNIDYGDRDSVGLFQQRTSQGWGTVEEIMDPVYSTNAFYDGLVKVPGYTELPITEAAQAVQRSGFPDAYAQHEGRSRAFAAALTGQTATSLTCRTGEAPPLDPADTDAVATAMAAVEARVDRDLGPLPVTREGTALVVDASALPGEDAARLARAVAHWAVASASTTDVVAVSVGTDRWSREAAAWAPAQDGATVADGLVRLDLVASS